jgi:hypothetical protein
MGEMWDVVGPDCGWILVVRKAPVAPGTSGGYQASYKVFIGGYTEEDNCTPHLFL